MTRRQAVYILRQQIVHQTNIRLQAKKVGAIQVANQAQLERDYAISALQKIHQGRYKR